MSDLAIIEANVPAVAAKIAEAERADEIAGLEKAASLTMADLIREGSSCTEQRIGGWTGEDGSMCALSAAICAAKARHLI